MSVKMIQDRLDGYGCRSTLEEEQSLREITQEIALAALGRTNFFQQVGFQGGTCLRIFHGLNRFSEDLDFALRRPDPSFMLKPYLDALARELTAYGYDLEFDDRSNIDQVHLVHLSRDAGQLRLARLSLGPDGPVEGPTGAGRSAVVR
jgi:hypothetical protein